MAHSAICSSGLACCTPDRTHTVNDKHHSLASVATRNLRASFHIADSRQLSRAQPQAQHTVNRSQHLLVTAAVKKTAGKNVVCSKVLISKEGQEQHVEKLCKDLLDFTGRRRKDRTSGILAFECSKDPFEPNKYHLWERYESNAAMGLHNSTEEFKGFMEKIQEYIEEPVGMALYAYKDGQLGNASIQGGPKGEGGLDDATGAGGAGGASYEQTSAALGMGDLSRGDEEEKTWGMDAGGFKFPWQKSAAVKK